jgi:hypothetical protein
MCPLCKKSGVIDELEIQQKIVDTLDMISSENVKGLEFVYVDNLGNILIKESVEENKRTMIKDYSNEIDCSNICEVFSDSESFVFLNPSKKSTKRGPKFKYTQEQTKINRMLDTKKTNHKVRLLKLEAQLNSEE